MCERAGDPQKALASAIDALAAVDTTLLADQDLHDHVFGQPVQMELHRVPRPVASPVVVQVDLHRLVLLIDTLGEEVLNARIFGKGNVWADVEEEPAVVPERRGVPAMVGILVVHYGRDALGLEPVCGTEPSHPASEDNNVWH